MPRGMEHPLPLMAVVILLALQLCFAQGITTWIRSYPVDGTTLQPTASERFYAANGQISDPATVLNAQPGGKLRCTNPVDQSVTQGCSSGFTGVVPINLGDQFFSITAVGGGLDSDDLYSGFTGLNAGGPIENEFFQPMIWLDKGEFTPAPGELIAVGPARPLTATDWTEWDLTGTHDRVTGIIWVGLMHTQGDVGFLFWMLSQSVHSGGVMYYVNYPGLNPSDDPPISALSGSGFGSAGLYVRVVFNCTRNEQCFGHGECIDTGCVCDYQWTTSTCQQFLIAPPSYDAEPGETPPSQPVRLTHTEDCPYFCFTLDGSTPVCAPEWSCAVGTRYTAPFVITNFMNITSVACAASGLGSEVVSADFTPSPLWTCQTNGVPTMIDLTSQFQIRPSYTGTYAANADCQWQIGDTGVAYTDTADLDLAEYAVDLTGEDTLEIFTRSANGNAWVRQHYYDHITTPSRTNGVYNTITLTLPILIRFASGADDQRAGFNMTATLTGQTPDPTCGNGQHHPLEACDDGNNINGDGCSSTCTIEDGYVCTGNHGAISVCQIPTTCGLACSNGGTCVTLATSEEVCVCANGYVGATCDTDVSMCPCAFCREQCWEGVGPYFHCCSRDETCNGHGTCSTETWGPCDCEYPYQEWNCSYTGTPTVSYTPTPTAIPTTTASRTLTSTRTQTGTPTTIPTSTSTVTWTGTPTPGSTPTSTPTPSPTPTPTSTDSRTQTPTESRQVTPDPTRSDTPSGTSTPTLTPTETPSTTSTPVPTGTPTRTASQTHTRTATLSHLYTNSMTQTHTKSPVPTKTDTPTQPMTATVTQTSTPTLVPTGTPTGTITVMPTGKVTLTPTSTPTPSLSSTPTLTPTMTPSTTITSTLGEMEITFEGAAVTYHTVYSLGDTSCEWRYVFQNRDSRDRYIFVDFNSTYFEVAFSGDFDNSSAAVIALPAGSVTACFTLIKDSVLTPHRLNFTFAASTALATAPVDIYVLNTTNITVYVLPEPMISTASFRTGNWSNCKLIHNSHIPFEGYIELVRDASPTLFRGVYWEAGTEVVQGSTLQTRMTIRTSTVNVNSLDLIAVTELLLPDEATATINITRHCNLTFNHGPDGTSAAFTTPLVAANRRVLQPLSTYSVEITGWTHWATIYYSMWCYWESDTQQRLFRLSQDSISTNHSITIPASATVDSLVLVARATDQYAFPHVNCTGCNQVNDVVLSSEAVVTAAVDAMLVANWTTVEDLLNILTLTAKADFLPTETWDSILKKTVEFAYSNDTAYFVDQTTSTFYAHLSTRVTIEDYDMGVLALFNQIVTESNGNLTVNALQGIAWVYGTVLRREAFPLINQSRTVWGKLYPSPSPSAEAAVASSKFSLLSDSMDSLAAQFGTLPDQASKFQAQNTVAAGDAAPVIRDYILTALKRQAQVAAFRHIDCIQADPVNVNELCYTACTVTAYSDEFGTNYSRIAPAYPEDLSSEAQAILQWIIANRVWLDGLQPTLPEFLTVASVQIWEDCNFHKVDEHLSGPLWRVNLLDGANYSELYPFVNGTQIVMPLVTNTSLQDCKAYEADLDTYVSTVRSPLNGFCMLDDIFKWASATDPNLFPATDEDPFPWLLLVILGIVLALMLCCLLALCLHYKWRMRKRSKLDDNAVLLNQPGSDIEARDDKDWHDKAPPPTVMNTKIASDDLPETVRSTPSSSMINTKRDDIGDDDTPHFLSKIDGSVPDADMMDSRMQTQLASSSSKGDPAQFMSQIDKSIPDATLMDSKVNPIKPQLGAPDDVQFISQIATGVPVATMMDSRMQTQQTGTKQKGPEDPAQFMSAIDRGVPDALLMDTHGNPIQPGGTQRNPDDAQLMSGINRNVPDALMMDTQGRPIPTAQRAGPSDDAQFMSGINRDVPSALMMDTQGRLIPTAQRAGPSDDAQFMSGINRNVPDALMMDTQGRPIPTAQHAGPSDDAQFMSGINRNVPDALMMDTQGRPIPTAQRAGPYAEAVEDAQFMSGINRNVPDALMMDTRGNPIQSAPAGPAGQRSSQSDTQFMSEFNRNVPDALLMDTQGNPIWPAVPGGAGAPDNAQFMSRLNHSVPNALMMDTHSNPIQPSTGSGHPSGGGGGDDAQFLSGINRQVPTAMMMDAQGNPTTQVQHGQGQGSAPGGAPDNAQFMSAIGDRGAPMAMMMDSQGNPTMQVAGGPRGGSQGDPVQFMSEVNSSVPDATVINTQGNRIPGSGPRGGSGGGDATQLMSGQGSPHDPAQMMSAVGGHNAPSAHMMDMDSDEALATKMSPDWMSRVQNRRNPDGATLMDGGQPAPVKQKSVSFRALKRDEEPSSSGGLSAEPDAQMMSAIAPRGSEGPPQWMSATTMTHGSQRPSGDGSGNIAPDHVDWMSRVRSDFPEKATMMQEVVDGIPISNQPQAPGANRPAHPQDVEMMSRMDPSYNIPDNVEFQEHNPAPAPAPSSSQGPPQQHIIPGVRQDYEFPAPEVKKKRNPWNKIKKKLTPGANEQQPLDKNSESSESGEEPPMPRTTSRNYSQV